MKRRKVLQVIRPAEGGMKGHLMSLSRGLRDKGLEIEIACPDESAVAAECHREGFVVHPIDLTGPLRPKRDLTCLRQLAGIIRQGGYDLCHFHGSKAGMVGRAAAVLTGFRNTVVTVHNFIVYEEVPVFKRVVFRYGEKTLSRVTARIITVSEALKSDLVSNFGIKPGKIVPVYNGIDMPDSAGVIDRVKARADLGVPERALVVGTLARMAPQKGLEYFIRAVPEILGLRNEWEVVFIIAGDGPLRPQLEEIAVKTGARERIWFPGYVEDSRKMLQAFDVFVTPSISEGLSITTIEAMAAGLPVVASRVGGLPELVKHGENGLLAESRNPQALAEAVSELLSDREKRQRFGQNGQAAARQRFSTRAMIDRTYEVYTDIFNGRLNVDEAK